MRRRRLLATAVLAPSLSAGCLAGLRGHGSPSTVADPPDWLRTNVECPNRDAVARVEHGSVLDYDDETSVLAVVSYDELRKPSRLLVDFCIQHGRAETCEPVPRAYRDLASDIGEKAMDGRWADQYTHPSGIAVQTNRHYHGIDLRLRDMVFP